MIPERLYQSSTKQKGVELPKKVIFNDLSKFNEFISVINQIGACKTPGCSGNLVPIRVESLGLGGAISVYVMDVNVRVLYSIAVTHIIWHHIPMKSVCQ